VRSLGLPQLVTIFVFVLILFSARRFKH